ncbi:MAG TPA: DUF3106 domain-containing protein [Edaphobacter sp.]|jgi:hypothetical protein|nr:DUF3106 domain-containing protein [Edaphobacter sp.]
MTIRLDLRRVLKPTLAGLLLLAATEMVVAQPAAMRRAGQAGHPAINAPRQAPKPGGGGPKANQEHLAQWMDRHSNLPLADQQRALEKEPGFRDLPPETQQRMRDRLTQLNNMSPEQRQRTLERTEIMEHLTPEQRQQFRSSVQQLGAFPEDRRRMVARAFHDLREMPVPQRQAVLNSDRFRGQFSDQERTTLSNLLSVEPYIPVQRPNEGPAVGK